MADEQQERRLARHPEKTETPEREWDGLTPDDVEARTYRPNLEGAGPFHGPDDAPGWDEPSPDDLEPRQYRPNLGWGADRQQPGRFAGLGPRDYRRSDDRIREDVCDRLTQHGQIEASDIDVEVSQGEVTLSGVVEDRRTKRLAEQVADSVAGVRDLHNELLLRNFGESRGGPEPIRDRRAIRNGMHVAGSDGQTIGRVKEVLERGFVVDRPAARDLFVPFAAVDIVSHQWLALRLPAREVERQGWPSPALTPRR